VTCARITLAGTVLLCTAACGQDSGTTSATQPTNNAVADLVLKSSVGAAADVEAEVAVVECMSEKGFRYVPVLTSTNPEATQDTQFVAEYGYGILTSPPEATLARTLTSRFETPSRGPSGKRAV